MISVEAKMSERTIVEDWELLAQIALAYRNLSDSFMDQIDMHRAQATVLCRLFVQNGMTQTEIADQLSIQGATVTSMLQRMEEANLVTRQRDADDNRLVRVYLTDLGREKERDITGQFVKLEETIFAGIPDDQRDVLRQMLYKLLNNMTDKG